MNSSIAAASLLGFGDKPASEALQEFSTTLGKIYNVQEKQLKEEETSRKRVTDEYFKDRREKKRRESDLAEILKGMNNIVGTTSKSGAKKKGGMSLMSKLLLGAGVALAGKALYDTVSTQIFESVKETVEDMIDPILGAFETVFEPIRRYFSGDEEDVDPSTVVPDTAASTDSTVESSGKTKTKDIEDGTSNRQRYKVIYDIAKQQGDPMPELTAAQAMFESGYLQSKLAVDANNPFGQTGPGNDGTYDYDKYPNVTWAQYSDLQSAVKARIKRWATRTPQGSPGYGKYKTPMAGAKGIIENYAPAAENDHDAYLSAIEGIMKANGHDPYRKLAKGGRAGGKNFPTKKLQQSSNRNKLNKARKGDGPPSEQTLTKSSFIGSAQKRAKGGKIFLHWTGGGYESTPSGYYHTVVTGSGRVAHMQDYSQFSTPKGHTWRRNSTGVGISMASMHRGVYGPSGSGDWTNAPKQAQIDATAEEVARIAKMWGWSKADIKLNNVMTHAEAASLKDGSGLHPNYGPGSGDSQTKWDLIRLTKNAQDWSGGEILRAKAQAAFDGVDVSQVTSDEVTTGSPETSAPAGPGPAPASALPGRPRTPPPPKTLDEAIDQAAGQALAPLIGLFGALSGNPVQFDIPGSGAQATGSGKASAGAASITDPNARALLNAIADAEGTSGHPNNGYNTMFTGKQFSGSTDHPRAIQRSGGLASDAAGRYQFLSTTWDSYAKGRDMSPANQDAVALDLVALKQGVDIADGLSKQEIYKLGREWASIEGGPQGVPGGSYGGQAKYSADEFMRMYQGYGGKVQGLQKGGMVGSQINTGGMRGSNNPYMSKLRALSHRMKRKGPKVITVPMPSMPPKKPMVSSTGGGGFVSQEMTMSQLADFNRRLAMGALT